MAASSRAPRMVLAGTPSKVVLTTHRRAVPENRTTPTNSSRRRAVRALCGMAIHSCHAVCAVSSWTFRTESTHDDTPDTRADGGHRVVLDLFGFRHAEQASRHAFDGAAAHQPPQRSRADPHRCRIPRAKRVRAPKYRKPGAAASAPTQLLRSHKTGARISTPPEMLRPQPLPHVGTPLVHSWLWPNAESPPPSGAGERSPTARGSWYPVRLPNPTPTTPAPHTAARTATAASPEVGALPDRQSCRTSAGSAPLGRAREPS